MCVGGQWYKPSFFERTPPHHTFPYTYQCTSDSTIDLQTLLGHQQATNVCALFPQLIVHHSGLIRRARAMSVVNIQAKRILCWRLTLSSHRTPSIGTKLSSSTCRGGGKGYCGVYSAFQSQSRCAFPLSPRIQHRHHNNNTSNKNVTRRRSIAQRRKQNKHASRTNRQYYHNNVG